MPDWADRLCEIVKCELCDDDGIRLNQLGRCDHTDYGPIAKRGIAMCMEALKKGSK